MHTYIHTYIRSFTQLCNALDGPGGACVDVTFARNGSVFRAKLMRHIEANMSGMLLLVHKCTYVQIRMYIECMYVRYQIDAAHRGKYVGQVVYVNVSFQQVAIIMYVGAHTYMHYIRILYIGAFTCKQEICMYIYVCIYVQVHIRRCTQFQKNKHTRKHTNAYTNVSICR